MDDLTTYLHNSSNSSCPSSLDLFQAVRALRTDLSSRSRLEACLGKGGAVLHNNTGSTRQGFCPFYERLIPIYQWVIY